MSEKEFEERIDGVADRFEKRLPKNGIPKKCVRRSMKSISIMAEIGVILGAGLGIVGVMADMITSITFRRT